MIFLLLLLFFILFTAQRRRKMAKILEEAKKVKYNKNMALPIVGHGLLFLGNEEDTMKTFQKISCEAFKNKYGSTGVWLGSDFYFVICDAVDAEIVSKICLDKPDLDGPSRDFLGHGSIFAPVSVWRFRRRTISPSFSQKNLHSFLSTFNTQSKLMVDYLMPMAGAGTFSIWEYVTSFHMNSTSLKTLGISIHSQFNTSHPVLVSFNEYCKDMTERYLKIWLHYTFLYKLLPQYPKVMKNIQIMHDAIDEIIRKKRLEIQTIDSKSTPGSDATSEPYAHNATFLEYLINYSDGKGKRYTDTEIREESLVFLLAGTDTSAVGTCFTILMLSRHEDIQKKVYEEIHEIFEDSTRSVTVEDLSKLNYLEAVIKESIRLHPPVPIILRKNNRDLKLPSGITVSAGTYSAIMIWGINRNPRYWGEDAEEFNPDRFLKHPLKYPSSFMSFSFGPRNCLGNKYAMMSMKVALVNLLRQYQVLPPKDIPPEELKKPLRVEFKVMMKPVDGFKVCLKQRETK